MTKNKDFSVSEGDYSYNFSIVNSIKKLIYFLTIILPCPSYLKAKSAQWLGMNIVDPKKVFIGYNAWMDSAYPNKIYIGKDVIIGTGVKIIAHSAGTIYHKGLLRSEVKKVVIKQGALIGVGSIILPGVVIGIGAVISAGSVVTKSVENYNVVAGNPAVVIKRLK